MPAIAVIRHEIEQVLHPTGFSNTGWESIRRAALIPSGRHGCDLVQEQRLWVASALRRSTPQNKPVTIRMVLDTMTECDGDLSILIPGFVPLAPGHEALPASVLGRQLPDLIHQLVGYKPDDSRIRAWCLKLGFTMAVDADRRTAAVEVSSRSQLSPASSRLTLTSSKLTGAFLWLFKN